MAGFNSDYSLTSKNNKRSAKMVDHMMTGSLLPVGLNSSERHMFALKWVNTDIKMII